jgi:hypothetical protein
MNRRKVLTLLAVIPFIGNIVKALANDGVALVAAKHPAGSGTTYTDISEASLETFEINLPVYAYAGETVTCEYGHPICDFAETVHWGQTCNLPKHLTNWRQKEPIVGQFPLPICDQCGSQFVGNSNVFHFKEGWRFGPRTRKMLN